MENRDAEKFARQKRKSQQMEGTGGGLSVRFKTQKKKIGRAGKNNSIYRVLDRIQISEGQAQYVGVNQKGLRGRPSKKKEPYELTRYHRRRWEREPKGKEEKGGFNRVRGE